jgi:CheY-like chemotaxis protein
MRQKTILICDDDESVLEILCLILDKSGFNVIAEKNSLNVFSMVDRINPDLLLIDLWMPALKGDEVIRSLKNNPVTKSLPIILISASPGAAKIAAETGADGFLAKPFLLEDLMWVIESKLVFS